MSKDKQSTNTKNITVSDSAAERIQVLLKNKDKGMKLRVSVDGGGCSGFQYKFNFDPIQNEDDILLEKNGIHVLIDEISAGFMEGSEINYVEELGAAHFAISNPQASASCGCGNSFAV